jgi:hypothetical protein
MKTLRLIWLTIIQLAKQVCQIPKNIGKAVKQRQRQAALSEQETERLDRILNPSKYRGK